VALTRKGSRSITVHGRRFRWTVRPKPAYSQALAWSPLSFAVQADENPGRVLYVRLARPRPDNWLGKGSQALTPREVAQFIRRALDAGWDPSEPGSPFELTDSTGSPPLPETAYKPLQQPSATPPPPTARPSAEAVSSKLSKDSE
jgi:hypothetical protein